MRAVTIPERGGPEVLVDADLPEPHAGRGEVRLKVAAVAVNPADTVIRDGSMAGQFDPPPVVPGLEAAGIVDEIGQGTATELHIGDAAMAVVVPSGEHGAYAEYVVVPAASAVRSPAGVDHAAAATVLMNGLTARRALDVLGLPRGATIAVTGAAGALGAAVIQLAKLDRLQVIADAAATDEDLVRSLGADVVVRRGDDVSARIRAREADGVDALVDGSTQGDVLMDAVRDGGGIVTMRGHVGPDDRGITWHPVLFTEYAAAHDTLDGLRRAVERGLLTPRVADVLPVARAAEAHRRLEAGGLRGRLVLTF